LNPNLQPSAPPDPETLQREIADLRSCLGDVIAFSQLRSTWPSHELPRVVSSFAEALRNLVRADVVFVRARALPHPDLEALLTSTGVPSPADARRLREKLDPLLASVTVDSMVPITGLGDFDSAIVGIVPLGPSGESGGLAVVWQRPEMPDDLRRDLLGLGARHLMFALRERQEFERNLQESQQRFELAFDYAPIGMAIVALSGRWLQVNRSVCELLGYSESELLQMTFQDITHPDDLDADLALVERVVAGDLRRYSMEKRYIHKTGKVVSALLHVSLVRGEQDEPLYFVAQIKDITDTKRAEVERERLLDDLTVSRERLETLSRRLVILQEEERRTIARELHDEVGQILTGLRLMLETSARSGATPNLGHLLDVAGQLLQRVKDLSLNLRPPMLDDLGLVPTLLWHFERYRVHTRIEVKFRHLGVAARLPSRIEITAFRIIQEALTNVARHADAREVSVELWIENDRLHLSIEDDGRGFDDSAVSRSSSGLTGMHERAKLAGGELRLDSRVGGGGTRLSAEIPLAGESESPE